MIATSEKKVTDLDIISYDMMDFLFDGFLLFTRVRKGSIYERVMSILKMKGQNHSTDIHPIIIEKGGIKVITDQMPYSLSEKASE